MTESLIKSHMLHGVMTVTVNRPEKANSLTPEMLILLRDQFRQVTSENTARAVVVTGAGNREFCAGAEVSSHEAYEWGLVDQLVEHGCLDAACRTLYATPAESDGAHLQALKSMLRKSVS